LKGAQGGQTRRRGLQRTVDEVARNSRDGSGDGVRVSRVGSRVTSKQVFRQWAALHGDAGGKPIVSIQAAPTAA